MATPFKPNLKAKSSAEIKAHFGGNMIKAAAHLGIHKATLRRRIAKEAKAEPAPELDKKHRLGGTPADREIVRLQDEVRYLSSAIRGMHKTELSAQVIRELLGSLGRSQPKKPKWLVPKSDARAKGGREVPVTIWSDWHAGEVVRGSEVHGVNEFNNDILETRVRRLVATTIDLCLVHGPGNYPGIVINLLGDFVSGALHPELAKTDEEEIIPTTLRVRNLLIWALDKMIATFGFVYCPCTSGNHGRQTQKPEFKRYVYKNFDFLIYQLLIAHYSTSPNGKKIIFDCNDDNEVLFSVYGQRYLSVHGDMLGVKGGDGIIGSIGPIMRGEMKVGKQAKSAGRDYDCLLMGHYHQALYLPRIIVANSIKGSDEYAKNSLRASHSTPSQPLWFVHPKYGRTAYWEVYVEDPIIQASAEWVSWKKPHAGSYTQHTYRVST